MVDPHLLASCVCEKERKSELNSRAAGKGVWHLPKALSEELLLPPNALGQHVGARWPVQRGGTGSPILARALADARRSPQRANLRGNGMFALASIGNTARRRANDEI